MQKLFLLALFVVSVSVNAFIICPTCSQIKCPRVDSCNGRITKGFCRCCDECIVSLREGETCNPDKVYRIPNLGECGFNLFCSYYSKTCIYDNLTECQRHREKSWSDKRFGIFTPYCDTDGSYAPYQCHVKRCYCTTKEGKAILNYEQYRGDSSEINCRCARDQHTYSKSGLSGKTFMCEANGNYKKVQCSGSVCFCVDEFGKRIGNKEVQIAQSNSLNC